LVTFGVPAGDQAFEVNFGDCVLRMMILLRLSLLCLVFLWSDGHAAAQDVPDPGMYLSHIYSLCPSADVIEVEHTPDGYIEVEFLCAGKYTEAGIMNGKILYVEEKADPMRLPMEKISRKLEKRYAGWIVDEAAEVRTPDTSFYKVEIIRNGMEQNVYFALDGSWFRMNAVLKSDAWKEGDLKSSAAYQSLPYRFHQPDSIYDLPELLSEVSGIAIAHDSRIVYGVQDEIGAVISFDTQAQRIAEVQRFTDVGDFEDLAVAGDSTYVLRSDGSLFRFRTGNGGSVKHTMLPFQSLNMEGMCHRNGYLYFVSKEAPVTGPDNERHVFRMPAGSGYAGMEGYLEVNTDELSRFVSGHYPSLNISQVYFNPSAIAVHPVTGEIYILSAEDRFLAVYGDKKLRHVVPLPASVFFKPEGLSFFPNGDLLISSEGDKRGLIPGSIMLFRMK
jgi:uncharacterized protein YjiK